MVLLPGVRHNPKVLLLKILLRAVHVRLQLFLLLGKRTIKEGKEKKKH